MTLHDLLGKNACIRLDIIDVLGVVGQELSFILQESNEPMSR